jgi:hypothetical protein
MGNNGRTPQAGIPASTPPASEDKDPLVPLARALEIIALQVYQENAGAPGQTSTELFDGLACTVSALVPIFVLDAHAPRQLSERELGKAMFRKRGAEMYFVDGRAPLGNLAVTAEGIAKVIRILKGNSLYD